MAKMCRHTCLTQATTVISERSEKSLENVPEHCLLQESVTFRDRQQRLCHPSARLSGEQCSLLKLDFRRWPGWCRAGGGPRVHHCQVASGGDSRVLGEVLRRARQQMVSPAAGRFKLVPVAGDRAVVGGHRWVRIRNLS